MRTEPPEFSILENPSCEIVQVGGLTKLIARSTWSQRMAELSHCHSVNALLLSDALGWSGVNLDFLRDMPPLSWLSVGTDNSIDWQELLSQTALRSVHLRHRATAPKRIDFTVLADLQEAAIHWWAEWSSILTCTSLRSIHLKELEVDTIDCSGLEKLLELRVSNGRLLRSVRLATGAQMIACEIDHCPRLVPDLERLQAAKLLKLGGKLAFELGVLSECKNLETLVLARNGKVRLSFLEHLPNIQRVLIGPGSTLTERDRALVREINAQSS
jgi:hypothetical protein